MLDKNLYVDSNGYFTRTYLYLYGNNFKEVTKEKLTFDVYNKPWNDDFKRSDTTIIKKILQ